MSELYYIESIERVWGNEAVWWRPEGRGYTSNLDEAGKYTREEAAECVTEKDVAIPVDEIRLLSHRTVGRETAYRFKREFPKRVISKP